MFITFRSNVTPIMIIIFSILLLPYSSIENPITYKESKALSPFLISSFEMGTYADGTILYRVLFKNNPNNINLRLLHPNRTFYYIDTNISCIFCHVLHPLNPNYILIEDRMITQNKSVISIMDWKGNIISDLSFERTLNDPSPFLATSKKNESRFLVVNYGKTKSQLLCVEYTINSDGQVDERTNIKTMFDEIKIEKLVTLNDTWGIVFTARGVSSSYCYFSILSNEAKGQIPNDFKLHDVSSKNAFFFGMACVADFVQHYCLYINDEYNLMLFMIYSNNISKPTNLFSSFSFAKSYIYTIPNVGFLVEVIELSKSSSQIRYFVLNIEIDYYGLNNAFGEWVVKEPVYNYPFILPNKTIIHLIMDDDGSFSFSSKDLSSIIPKSMHCYFILYIVFINNNILIYFILIIDNPYNNTHVKQVYPSQNESISIGTNKISITFVHSIDLTTPVNISIYQKYNDENLLRQRFLYTYPYCIISDYLFTINLHNITFNVPNATYYVEIDDKFLRYKDENEMVPGIKLGNWIIKTTEGEQI